MSHGPHAGAGQQLQAVAVASLPSDRVAEHIERDAEPASSINTLTMYIL
jgi:hypothetical protein